MKKIFTTAVCLMAFFGAFSMERFEPKSVAAASAAPEVQALSPEMLRMAVDEFVNLTPSRYKEITGERLGFKNTVKLKAAQKQLKKEMRTNGDGITKGLYILLAILGLAWVAMGVKSDWNGSDWIVNLILVVLCWLPGFIHALIKMKDYYK